MGIELDQGSGPELLSVVGGIKELRNVVSPDPAEAPGEALVVCNEVLTKGKDIHRFTLCTYGAWPALTAACQTPVPARRAPSTVPLLCPLLPLAA